MGLTDFIDGSLFKYIKEELNEDNQFGDFIDSFSDRIMSLFILCFIFDINIYIKLLLIIESLLLTAYILSLFSVKAEEYRIKNHHIDYIGKIRFMILGIYLLYAYEYNHFNNLNITDTTFNIISLTFIGSIILCLLASFKKFIKININK